MGTELREVCEYTGKYRVVQCIRLSDRHQIQSIIVSWQHGALDEYGAHF